MAAACPTGQARLQQVASENRDAIVQGRCVIPLTVDVTRAAVAAPLLATRLLKPACIQLYDCTTDAAIWHCFRNSEQFGACFIPSRALYFMNCPIFSFSLST